MQDSNDILHGTGRIAIYTPTYNSGDRFFDHTVPSVLEQTYDNYKWVIVDDGSDEEFIARLSAWENRLAEDTSGKYPEIAVHYNSHSGTIGANKALACKLALQSGDVDYLLELDHDDSLTDDCLAEVALAFEQNPQACMVFSNYTEMSESGEFCEYAGWYWQYRDTEYKGRMYREAMQPDIYAHLPGFPMPNNMYWVFMPNHVRVYRADAYEFLGGYDKTLPYADDFDLFLKMFKYGYVHHIPKMLYIYHWGGNTWRDPEVNRKLQRKMAEVRNRHYDHVRVDLGSGENPQLGFIGVDIQDTANTQVICCDIAKKGIPYNDSTVDYINATDFIEHVADKVFILKEIYRVLKHGGVATIQVPSTDGRGAFQDPTHVSYWNENSFKDMYMNGKGGTDYRYGAEYCFDVLSLRTTPQDDDGVCWVMVQLIADKNKP